MSSTDGEGFYKLHGDNAVRTGPSAEADVSKRWRYIVDVISVPSNQTRFSHLHPEPCIDKRTCFLFWRECNDSNLIQKKEKPNN